MKKVILFFALIVSIFTMAQSPLSPVQIAERNKPATVMIQSTFKGTVSITNPVNNAEATKALAQQIKDSVAQGFIPQDKFWNTFIMEYCKNIELYMSKGTEVVERELNTTMIGSGFIITPDGMVVTNCHVVDENDEATQQSFAEEAFREIIKEDQASVEKSMGRDMTEEESNALRQANSWYFSQTLKVSDIITTFSAVLGVTGSKGKIVPLVIPAKLVTKGNAIPGKDVAVLQLTEKHVYPTIRIGDDKAMRVGDQVYVLGYPGVATFHPLISEESVSEATLTRGLVSAKRNMKEGWEVLQIDAAITHGNSGGPVMNDQGEVIGLATFGSPDMQRNQEIQGMNFIVPSTIVDEFIDRAKIKPEMSDISLAYEEAMDLYDAQHYKKALVKFQEVKDMNGSFPFVDSYIANTEKDIDKGLNKEPMDMKMYYYIGAGVGALLLILILFLVFRKKKSNSTNAAI